MHFLIAFRSFGCLPSLTYRTTLFKESNGWAPIVVFGDLASAGGKGQAKQTSGLIYGECHIDCMSVVRGTAGRKRSIMSCCRWAESTIVFRNVALTRRRIKSCLADSPDKTCSRSSGMPKTLAADPPGLERYQRVEQRSSWDVCCPTLSYVNALQTSETISRGLP